METQTTLNVSYVNRIVCIALELQLIVANVNRIFSKMEQYATQIALLGNITIIPHTNATFVNKRVKTVMDLQANNVRCVLLADI